MTYYKLLRYYLPVFMVVVLTSCKDNKVSSSDLFDNGVSKGKVAKELEEASGLVASMINPGYLWVHNDSGNPAEVYLLDDKAEIVMTCKLNGIKNRDWEDIAIRMEASGNYYLYVGDIGDNEARYEYKYLYLIEEPVFDGDKRISIDDVATITIQLPDGKRDMESMAFDHTSGDLFLISKREDQVNVYMIEARNLTPGDTIIPQKIGKLPYHNIVAADFSFSGNELLMKTYDEVFYWPLGDSLSVREALNRAPLNLKYKPEPQGESIAWTLGGDGFYTLSESVDDEKAKLLFYKRR